jgi:hypothetical protein
MPACARTNLLPSLLAAMLMLAAASIAFGQGDPFVLNAGWQLQEAPKVSQPAAEVSSRGFHAEGWYRATVPGTVLTTLVDTHVYPEPTYGENNRPEIIPDSLAATSFWYRTQVRLPHSYAGRRVWLNFDGINFASEIWVNGFHAGTTRGAFVRGRFDITAMIDRNKDIVIAVLVSPEPHPGIPHEHTWSAGVGKNGGVTATDGPTFLSTLGWDWLAPVRDRDTGIWQQVFLSASGPVRIEDPQVSSDLSMPRLDAADLTIRTNLANDMGVPCRGTLIGTIGDIVFAKHVEIPPHTSQSVSFDKKDTAALHLQNPRLWWPNGYGAQNLYNLHLTFAEGRRISDAHDVSFGIRKIEYTAPGSDNLTIIVNGVKVFIRGGDWGLDEALKRIPRDRLDAAVRMHRDANLNMIRNWVGQSTGEDFYQLCDFYGILVWDEFFQPNPTDGPNPDDLKTYLENVRDKVLRFRNHPSIALWCGRNEGDPPAAIDDVLRTLMDELDPQRLYQSNSTDGRGVISHGPYGWRAPREFYKPDKPFKTETGSISVPTLESIHGMMPQRDWETIGDDWAQHDFAKGAQHGDLYPGLMAARYGAAVNLADFVRKAQLMNYEAFRAMFEGRNASMFQPNTGVMTWMSNPAQPSFVWQLYHYDLEPNASLFAVKLASEKVHIQLNEATGYIQIVNNQPYLLDAASAHISIYNLNGTLAYVHEAKVRVDPSSVATLDPIEIPHTLSSVYFVRLELDDSSGRTLSRNFYWQASPMQQDMFLDMNGMPVVEIQATPLRQDNAGTTRIEVELSNPAKGVALMIHMQLRRRQGQRILPVFYSDNYISLVPGERRTIAIEAATQQLGHQDAVVVIDGWNVSVSPLSRDGVSVSLNVDAQIDSWPVTGLPFQVRGLR